MSRRFSSLSFSLVSTTLSLLLGGALPVSGFDRPANTSPTRSMVLARRGVVATSQALASEAGVALLRAGGNAFDAAVGAAAVLNVVEPMSTGIGGDMFAIAWPAKEGRLVGLNGSGRSAATATVESFRRAGHEKVPTHGPHAVTVPGAFHGWVTLHSRYGKLPLEAVLAEAIHHAEAGFPVTEVIAENWTGGLVHAGVPEFRDAYLIRDDAAGGAGGGGGAGGYRAPRAGEVFRQPDLARTFRRLAKGGIEELYRGGLAREIAGYLEAKGSLIRYEDLARHESTWEEPIGVPFRGYELWELPPNGQGIAALEMLNILEGYDLRALGHNSTEYLHLIVEAKKLAFADRDTFVTDPTFRQLPVATLISKEYAGKMRARIDRGRAGSYPRSTLDTGTDTIYLTAADGEGNVVSFINSLYYGFGSGLVVPGTGICLQNRGALFSLDPAHLNRIEPSKRPLHTIIPAMVTKDGKPYFSYGVMGGDMQPQGHVQVLLNLLEFGMTPQAAGDAPRVREVEGAVAAESGIPLAALEGLRAKGHRLTASPGGFGGFQGILIDRERGVLHGASDSRKDGAAAGY
jgi:gamma-glutamyltranspeptidase/glutathione hydrolase